MPMKDGSTTVIARKRVNWKDASLVLGYSRKLYVQYYPCFTRFEAKIFLNFLIVSSLPAFNDC